MDDHEKSRSAINGISRSVAAQLHSVGNNRPGSRSPHRPGVSAPLARVVSPRGCYSRGTISPVVERPLRLERTIVDPARLVRTPRMDSYPQKFGYVLVQVSQKHPEGSHIASAGLGLNGAVRKVPQPARRASQYPKRRGVTEESVGLAHKSVVDECGLADLFGPNDSGSRRPLLSQIVRAPGSGAGAHLRHGSNEERNCHFLRRFVAHFLIPRWRDRDSHPRTRAHALPSVLLPRSEWQCPDGRFGRSVLFRNSLGSWSGSRSALGWAGSRRLTHAPSSGDGGQ